MRDLHPGGGGAKDGPIEDGPIEDGPIEDGPIEDGPASEGSPKEDLSSGQPVPSPGELIGPDDLLSFGCRGGLACSSSCCRDVSIYLTPYDLLRLRQGLGLSSRVFLDRYALVSHAKLVPLVLLGMNEEDERRCPFVTPAGCSVYDDRPWACRMFPLDLGEQGGYRVSADRERCPGLGQGEPTRVRAHLGSQGVAPYLAEERLWGAVTGDPRLGSLEVDNPAILQMVFMATYNLDAFREFLFESSFLSRFSLPAGRVERLQKDELELLHFGYEWLEFGLFGKKSLRLSHDQAPTTGAKGDPDETA
ncbi:MAG: YkgJ family cysteine cluster protein [Polyangia bacterium]|nr:YkgJ family cysteine cluster protein [Polyangia bacterium]